MPTNKDKKQESGGVADGKSSGAEKDAILNRLEALIAGNTVKLDQIIAQNAETKQSIEQINTDLTDLKSNMQFMDTTIENLKATVEEKVEKGVFQKFQEDVNRKIDDLTNRSMRNNMVFWNIPEKAEAGIGCKTLLYNILERQFELEYARDIVIERAHRTKIILEDGSIMNPRLIHAKLLNWEDKEFLLKIGPSRLKRNNYGFGVKIYVSDDVTKKVREDRKILRTRYLPDIRQKPGVKVAFIPFQVPARIQYKEGDSWKFIYLPNS